MKRTTHPKLRRGLIGDLKWIFDDAICMQGAGDPDAIAPRQKYIRSVRREVLALLKRSGR
jgi:hypothetical protein